MGQRGIPVAGGLAMRQAMGLHPRCSRPFSGLPARLVRL